MTSDSDSAPQNYPKSSQIVLDTQFFFFVVDQCNELEEVTLSRSTVRRARKSIRQSYALQKRNDFAPTVPLFLHRDGKMVPDLTRVRADRKNRVAVVVSWKNNKMLLGALNIPSGTGKNHANVSIEL